MRVNFNVQTAIFLNVTINRRAFTRFVGCLQESPVRTLVMRYVGLHRFLNLGSKLHVRDPLHIGLSLRLFVPRVILRGRSLHAGLFGFLRDLIGLIKLLLHDLLAVRLVLAALFLMVQVSVNDKGSVQRRDFFKINCCANYDIRYTK